MELTALKGIGEKTAGLFARLGVENAEDLLTFYPRAYERFDAPVRVCDAPVGEVCAVCCIIESELSVFHAKNLAILNGRAKDASGAIRLTFFNMPYLKKSLKPGTWYVFRGLLQKKNGNLLMEQPKLYKPDDYAARQGHLLPRYSQTKGLTNQTIIKAVKQAFIACTDIEDPLPEDIRARYDFPGKKEALYQLHFPDDAEKLTLARNRLVFEEFYFFILRIRHQENETAKAPNVWKMLETADIGRLVEKLPYRLTAAQEQAWQEICADLCGEHVMNRLLQGDVGSGKTILAFLALLLCAANGMQGALMAPTEVLARQHFTSLNELIKDYDLPLRPVLLTGSVSAKDKQAIYRQMETMEANVVIGTHALIQEKVPYQKLALVITDEQHRFGVRQRDALANKGKEAHVLVMSATPIPRTLAQILYGDLQISTLHERPEGRLPIKNCVVDASFREKSWAFLQDQVSEGRQAYVVCPLIEDGEVSGLEDVLTYRDKLRMRFPETIRIEALHGRMRPADKNRTMEEFAAGNIDILVSTTVIEVGVNVPNATVMMIENADRFGLAQLHQLRGRVGRGEHQSYCIFISGTDNQKSMDRLQILQQSNDGFEIADEDLKLRGPGELFGVRQSGDLRFRLGDIYQDKELLLLASKEVDQLEQGI